MSKEAREIVMWALYGSAISIVVAIAILAAVNAISNALIREDLISLPGSVDDRVYVRLEGHTSYGEDKADVLRGNVLSAHSQREIPPSPIQEGEDLVVEIDDPRVWVVYRREESVELDCRISYRFWEWTDSNGSDRITYGDVRVWDCYLASPIVPAWKTPTPWPEHSGSPPGGGRDLHDAKLSQTAEPTATPPSAQTKTWFPYVERSFSTATPPLPPTATPPIPGG